MIRSTDPLRLVVAILALVGLVALIALPVLAADPTPTPGGAAAASERPGAPADPGTPDHAERGKKPKGEPVTVSGVVGARAGADGRTEYTLTSGSTVLILDAGPSWFYGDDHPLASSVGKSVSIAGTRRAGEDEVDVETVDGEAIREPGKPPWAGGWKVVGERHPGWSQEKAARWAAKRAEQAERHGVSCWPPGHCKSPEPATGD